ncbi:P-type conjugative transfer protein TrbG [Sphingobium sp. Sx8-8]|uniref:P-type conjugative transfer protein TrbG n=1 Tax=Sphingobium sp. Sx8-8 TaxID=2933617 RepID=UPI001F56FFD3|nr:P-type conjugative transfer protein TrbG [Sphingobium sp. Sx8-8]
MKSAILSALVGILAAVPAIAQPETTAGSVRHVAAANRAATFRPAPSGFIGGAQVYPWSEGTIYIAYTAPGLVTDIVLQPGESLVAVASGDTARWVIGDTTSGSGDTKQTHLLVKPFSAGLVTNLVVTTDRRTYHVRLVSTSATALSSMRWTYPQDELLALRRKADAERAATPIASGLSLETLHFNYAISGDRPGWRPLRAFDDGQRTYVEFPASLASNEAPPLFLVDREGKAELVNYRLSGRFYVVDRIFDAAELRLGLKKQQVVRIDRIAPAAKRRGA